LARHLRKLQTRGLVRCRKGRFAVARPPNAFGRALLRLAAR
jgi:hypothetical protein